MRLDPITLEILNNKVTSIAEEAGFTVQRTGRTLYVKETADFGTALATLDGRFFAYPNAIGVSGFIDLDCGPTIRAVKNLKPGDVILTNHPYKSEGLVTHIPDLHLIAPYFHEGRLVCFGWSFLHSSDMGGRVPGSISPSNTEIFQEGMLIPPTKLCIEGRLNEDLVEQIRANSRTPEENVGDLQAMLAAHKVAERRVGEVIEQHGLETFMQAQEDLIRYAASKARAVLRRLPDGVYEFWDYMDDDLVTSIPVRIRVQMSVRDGHVKLDFSGTDPQTLAAFNVPTSGKRHAWLTLRLMALICTQDRTMPLNAGIFDNVTVVAPKGSVLHPEWPGAVGVRHATAVRINDVLNGAILQAAPQLMPAAAGGVVIPIVMAEPPDTSGRQNVLVIQPMVGGMGARFGHDGVDGRDSGISNLANNPIETIESSAGAIIRSYRLRSDSGGPGRWRGGVGLELTFEVVKDGVQILGRGMERFRFQPWGFAGGEPGAHARTIVNRGRPDEREVGKIDMVVLKAGDTMTVATPGGGGYGDPYAREPAKVLDDMRRGLVSMESARALYGVAIVGGSVNEEATRTLRSSRVPVALGRQFGFGPAREIWDRIFDDESMTGLANYMLTLPLMERHRLRRAIFAEVIGDRLPPGVPVDTIAHEAEELRERFRNAVARAISPAAQVA